MGSAESFDTSNVGFSYHALERMGERQISRADVIATLQFGRKRPGKNELRIAEHDLERGIRLRVVYDDGIRNGVRFIRIVTVISLGSSRT